LGFILHSNVYGKSIYHSTFYGKEIDGFFCGRGMTMGFVKAVKNYKWMKLSHPSEKNKNVARVGHPAGIADRELD
jgi:hypothetical protein